MNLESIELVENQINLMFTGGIRKQFDLPCIQDLTIMKFREALRDEQYDLHGFNWRDHVPVDWAKQRIEAELEISQQVSNFLKEKA
ncbi:MAG: hypothetical protein V3V74_02415 [Nitrosomonadaceae bacterium]